MIKTQSASWRTKIKIFLIFIGCLSLFLLSFDFTLAYKLLEPLPGLGESVPEEGGLSRYASWLFTFVLAAAAFLAVLMIVIGGIQIIVSGASESARKNAKDRIRDAIWGLLLAISAWLILYTINPDLVKGTFSIEPVTLKEIPEITEYPTTGEWVLKLADDSKTRNYLREKFIFTNKDPCPTSYYDKNCTMLSDLPQNAVDGVIRIKEESKAAITITGGTEIGVHKEHGPNKPVLDLRYKSSGGGTPNTDLKIYLDKQVGKTMKPGDRLDTKDGKMNILFEKNSDGSEHFHITFR